MALRMRGEPTDKQVAAGAVWLLRNLPGLRGSGTGRGCRNLAFEEARRFSRGVLAAANLIAPYPEFSEGGEAS